MQCHLTRFGTLSLTETRQTPSLKALAAYRCFAMPCMSHQGGSQTHAPSVTDAWVSVAELLALQPSPRYVCALLGSTAQLHNSPAPLFHCLALSGLSLLCGCDGFNVAPAVSRGKQFFEIFSAAEYVLSYVDVPLANQRRMYHNRSNERTRKDYCWRNPPHSFLLDQVSTSVEGSRQGLDASMDRQRAQQVA